MTKNIVSDVGGVILKPQPSLAIKLILKDLIHLRHWGEIRRRWVATSIPYYDTIHIFEELKEDGYKIYGLSNVDADDANYLQEKYNLYDIFDGVILSCNTGMRKPNPEIYKLLMNKFKIKPEESLYIDNMKKYLLPAKRLGFKTLLFKSPDELKQNLAKHEIYFVEVH